MKAASDPGPDAFREENDASALKEPLAKLYRLKEKYNVCLLFSWHFSKTPSFVSGVYSFRGSSAIAGKMDAMYSLTSDKGKRYLKLDKLRLDCPSLRQDQKWIIDMTHTDKGKELTFIDAQEDSEARLEKKRELIADALSNFEPEREYTATEIVKRLLETSEGEFKESTAKRRLKEWEGKGYFRLITESRGKQAAVYVRTVRELTNHI